MTKLNTGLSGCKLELVNGLLRKHSASVEYNSRLISQAEKQIVFSKRIYKNIETNEQFAVTSKYLLACDGANSTVRKLNNIKLNSLDADEAWMVVDGYTKNSFDCFTDIDAIQYCNPTRPTTIIQGVENCFRFEIAYMPGDTVEEIQKESVFRKHIDQWIGDNEVEFSRTAVYSFHAASAEKWSNGNIFLLGDAAHQMPPFMGQGMNSGCRDAENLLWKINGVLVLLLEDL